ncbi:MAG: nucleoside triphosphate pyrophosphohydrolase [Deltaproteobacteria bacterium]|nr:nucleoside triphosphate pyrophosphohydrolase [Deltaproteobacteria bacterium]
MDKNELAKSFLELCDLVSRLRGPGGCPWDAKQTEETIKTYLLEEAYEVVDAVDQGDQEDLCHELGDLLFQIIFISALAEEKGNFALVKVIKEITRKMVNRHPHVFGSVKAASAEEVAENWVKIKKQERGLAEASSELMESVPSNLPALLRAHRLMERAGQFTAGGRDMWSKAQDAFHKLSRVAAEKEGKAVKQEIGDLLFTLVGLAGQKGLNAEHVLREKNERFLNRFRKKPSL